ncbi:MAG: hypothetical protein DHS20C13_06810 [Thermodesulfobacteriota bacterium]|nr:MAG: hypothetical protein DHS20C13_06810 [Thermodesulfobacteriota bacterium]
MSEEKKQSLVKYQNRGLRKSSNRSLTPYDNNYQQYEINIDEDVNLRDYIDILLRRKWIIISCLLISIITVAISSLMMEKTYLARTNIEIVPFHEKITDFAAEDERRYLSYNWDDTRKFYETQYKVLSSQALGAIIYDQLKTDPFFTEEDDEESSNKGFFQVLTGSLKSLWPSGNNNDKEVAQEALDPEIIEAQQEKQKSLLVRAFMSGYSVVPDRKSRLVEITYESTDPRFSAKAVNTLVQKYQEWNIIKKREGAEVAGEFLQVQLDEAKAQLERSEQELVDFARKVDIVSLEDEQNILIVQLEEINRVLAKTETDRLTKEALFKEVEEGNYESLPKIVDDNAILELQASHTDLKAEYENKAVVFGPNFPEMKQLQAQLDKIDSEIQKRIEGIAGSIKKDYQATLRTEELLKKRAKEQNVLVTDLNEKASKYRILENEVQSSRDFHDEILSRFKQMKITSAVQPSNVKLIDKATIPLRAYKPKIILNLIYSFIFGFMVGCFLAFAVEHLDSTIRDEEEVKRRYAVPFLGSIPLMSDDGSVLDSIETAVIANPKSLVAEAFRVVRTSILYSSPDHPPNIILVTSTQPLEGKTTAASNLALSMVQAGNKVLVIDADLRKPRMHKIFLNNGIGGGLSAYLVGQIDRESLILNTDTENFDIIPSGPIPPNPVELISSKKMRELLESVYETYDAVIMDGPPIANFADSRLLSRLAEGVVIVTSIGITQRQSLRTSIEEINKVGGKIIGTIVNRVESKSKFGYGYYYYYSNEDAYAQEKGRLSSPSS